MADADKILFSTDVRSQPSLHKGCVEIVSNISGDVLLTLTAGAAEDLSEQMARHARYVRQYLI